MSKCRCHGTAAESALCIGSGYHNVHYSQADLDAAVAKARDDEREACAKIADDFETSLTGAKWDEKYQVDSCAEAIRARGGAM